MMLPSSRTLKLPLIVLGVALSLAACSKDANQGLDNGGLSTDGPATPGSPAEFHSAAVGDRVMFELNQSTVSPTGRQTLQRQAQWLRQYSQYTATVEGHADERGTDEYNFALGSRRAEAVRSFLVAQGVAARRLKTVSYGKTRPVQQCSEGDDSCQSQNRRAVTVLTGR